MRIGDDGAHLNGLIEAVPDLERLRGVRELPTKIRVDLADAHDDGSREAPFARATVAGGDHVRDDLVQLRVGHDDQDVLGAAPGLDPLPGGRRLRVDELRDLARADERDAGDARVVEDRVDRFLRSVDQVHDARGEAGLADEVHDELHRDRVLLGRLRDPAVPRRDRVRPEPELHHHGEVEWADPREHAEWLVQDLLIDPGARPVLQVVSHHEARDARGDLDVLDGPSDLASRLLDRLAHVLDDDPREVLEMMFHQIPQGEEVPRAVERWRLAPGIPCPEGLLHRHVDLIFRRERHACDRVAGRGVRVLEPPRRLRGAPRSADVVRQVPVVGLDLGQHRRRADHPHLRTLSPPRPDRGCPRASRVPSS